MNFKGWMHLNEQVQQISYQEAKARNLFGPVYHGTSEDKRDLIASQGFKIFTGSHRTGDVSHGYEMKGYGSSSVPPPVHHLGYGIYFTTNKSIAKDYNFGTAKGLKQYYLDVPRLETINFGSTNTMMKWWFANGYDMDASMDEGKRIQATVNLTNELKTKFDAVYYKGKGLYRLLDGDQICVFDPSRIYELNTELAGEGEISPGDRFVVSGTSVVVTVKALQRNERSTGGYYLSVSYKDPQNELKKVYGNTIWKNAIGYHPDLLERIKQNYKVDDDQKAIDIYVDNRINNSIKINFPSEWLGRKLKKGERFKSI